MNVVVIGAGIIGASVAEALASRGASVTVVDMRSPGRGATQASAGLLAPFIEAHDDRFLDLCTRSLALWDGFFARVRERSGMTVAYARTGTLEVALTVDEAARLTALKADLDRRGVASDWIDAAALPAVEPAVSRSARGGHLIPSQGFVAAPALVRALVQSARLQGAVFESPVEIVRVEPGTSRVTVRADGRELQADRVVVAAGTWSGRVKVAGVTPPPVKPIRGQMLELEWSGSLPARPVWGSRCYTVPWAPDRLLLGATVEDVGFDERSTASGIAELLAAVAELLPAASGTAVKDIRVGLRPATTDDFPIIGPPKAAPSVCFATGHFRNGVMLAPLTAEIVANYVLDGAVDPAFAATTPDRAFPKEGSASAGPSS